MAKAKPLSTFHRHAIQSIMKSSASLAEITKEVGVKSVAEYMLEDKPALIQYLSAMAAVITQQRKQISHNTLILSIFHCEMASLNMYGEEFKLILLDIVDRERKIQQRTFLAENSTQVNIHSDIWKLYEPHGNVLRLKAIDFTKIHSKSLRYEMKYYLQYIFQSRGKISVPLFCCQYLALNVLSETNPNIRYFSDITETDARALVLALESSVKDDGTPLSQYYIAKAVNSIRRIIDYLMGPLRSSHIKTPRPYLNPFASITFHNLRQYNTPTTIIPEEVVEQLDRYSNELPQLHKLLYDIFASTGLRLKEVLFLEEDCIETSRYPEIFTEVQTL